MARKAAAIAALVFVVATIVLLFRGPHFTVPAAFDDPRVEVACGSVATVGWPTDDAVLQHGDSFSHWSDHVVNDVSLTQTQRLGLALECADRRDTYLGFLIVLAVPTSILGAVAITRRPG